MSLINKLPSFYENNTTSTIQSSLNIEANNINNNLDELFNQFYVNSATFGLDNWEKMLGIPKNTNDIQTRRENIKAKMRSRGTSSIETIKNICEAYSNGEVEIIVDHNNYSFEIYFVGSVGIPKALGELDKTIEEIKPCHLAHSYKFKYNNHEYLTKYTHKELSQYTHDEIRNSTDI